MSRKANWLLLPLFLVIAYASAGIAAQFSPGEWYEGLQRAPWNPPNYIFPIVWSVLYALIGLAGWKIFSADRLQLKIFWVVQLVLNAMWSWLFFGQHWVGSALADLIFLTALVALLVVRCFLEAQRLAAWLLIPYLLWLLLAFSLNLYIFIFN